MIGLIYKKGSDYAVIQILLIGEKSPLASVGLYSSWHLQNSHLQKHPAVESGGTCVSDAFLLSPVPGKVTCSYLGLTMCMKKIEVSRNNTASL